LSFGLKTLDIVIQPISMADKTSDVLTFFSIFNKVKVRYIFYKSMNILQVLESGLTA